tara:strand:+ start:649 stop:1011 length:363 start_codon:yes stop_codon:yes gene_type:complete
MTKPLIDDIMPLLNISTSIKINDKKLFLKNCSRLVSKLTNKPERYVMVRLFDQMSMYFDSEQSPSCFIDLKSIGSLNPSPMSKEISIFMSNQLGIHVNRIYICFENIEASNWAWNGETFG